jgi:hypothetical protein
MQLLDLRVDYDIQLDIDADAAAERGNPAASSRIHREALNLLVSSP